MTWDVKGYLKKYHEIGLYYKVLSLIHESKRASSEKKSFHLSN